MTLQDESPPLRLFETRVTHVRFGGHPYQFHYRLPRILVDLDRLAELPGLGIGYNRFAPVSFSDRDHGPRDGRSLKPWIIEHLAGLGLGRSWGRIELWTFPRIWGYVFNPLSLWYCHDLGGSLKAVLFEVHNTFGEAHHYLVHDRDGNLGPHLHTGADKCFHVSPFQPLAGSYTFTLDHTATDRSIRIDYRVAGERRLLATEHARMPALTRSGIRRWAWLSPWTTLGVTLTIHWHALGLWLGGARFYPKPPPPDSDWSK